MRKLLAGFVVVAVTGGTYLLGLGAAAHAGHTVRPDATAKSTDETNTDHNLPLLISISPLVQAGERVAVDVNCLDGTATKNAVGAGNPDYSCAAQTVVFANPLDDDEPLSTPIVIEGDTVGEGNETFTVALFNARCLDGAGCTVNPDPSDVTVTITNDDPLPGAVAVNDASSPEGDIGQAKDITFTVTLSRPCTVAEGDLTVPFDTQSGSATEGTDYMDKNGTLTFVPGDLTEQVVVKTIGDNTGEPTETFNLVLGPALGGPCAPKFTAAAPSDLTGVGTITDDDGPPGTAVTAACSGNVSGDFNGDGRRDLAVGIPGQAINAAGNAGAVQVVYGALTTGLTDTGKQLIVQGADGVDDSAEAGDQFGACLAAGRFNGDTFWDLAIAAPGEDLTSTRGSFVDAGGVEVVYGTASGLNASGTPADQFWTQDSVGIIGGSENQDALGNALTVGDFNGDGNDDLAIGAQLEDVGTARNAGSVNVLPGGSSGLSATGDKLLHQDAKRFAGTSERDDFFGAALAAGDVDGDGRDDLVAGVPGEALGATARAGVIQVVRAGTTGLNGLLDRLWFQGNSSILDTAESGDRFGAAVAVGNLNGDGFDDVAVGIPLEDLGARTDVGGVAVLYGSSAGPSATNNELWSEADSTKTTGDTANAGDQFGFALTIGDFNGTSVEDLAIGVPFNDFAGTNAGSVNVLYGTETGLGSAQHFTQSDVAGTDGGEVEDNFGAALANGDYNGDARSDLAVGVAKEDVGTAPDAGAVDVVYGSATTLTPATAQHWTQEGFGAAQGNGSQAGDQYGASVG